MLTLDSTNTIGANDAKTHFSELLEWVAKGHEVTITRHGSPVARLVPARRRSTPEQRRAAIQTMQELSQSHTLGPLRVKDLIAEGRR